MDVQRRCRLLLLIYTRLDLIADVKYIIVRLYFTLVTFRNMVISNPPLYIDPSTNRVNHPSAPLREIVSLNTDGTNTYYLDVDQALYLNVEGQGLRSVGSQVRCLGCNSGASYILKTNNDLYRVSPELNREGNHLRSTRVVTLTETVYKLIIGISTSRYNCVYWLTNRGEVYCYGQPVFSCVGVSDPDFQGKKRLLVKDVIDMTANVFQLAIITADGMLHLRTKSSSCSVGYGNISGLKDTRRITFHSSNLMFHTDKHTYMCQVSPLGITIQRAFLATDIIWDGDKPMLDQHGQSIVELEAW